MQLDQGTKTFITMQDLDTFMSIRPISMIKALPDRSVPKQDMFKFGQGSAFQDKKLYKLEDDMLGPFKPGLALVF